MSIQQQFDMNLIYKIINLYQKSYNGKTRIFKYLQSEPSIEFIWNYQIYFLVLLKLYLCYCELA